VSIGIRGQTLVEVTDGLKPNARVILDPPPMLKDGGRVRMRAAP
jgi:hypothetical protein